ISIRIELGPSVLRHALNPRQRYRELRTAAGRALDRDVAIGCQKNPARDRQSEASSALSSLGGHEGFEDPSDQLGRDAFAVVLDADGDPFSVLLGGDPDFAALAD